MVDRGLLQGLSRIGFWEDILFVLISYASQADGYLHTWANPRPEVQQCAVVFSHG
jgi:hypothetical protein